MFGAMENIAGILKIEVAHAAHISWLTPPVGGIVSDFPVFVDSNDFAELSFSYLTGSLRAAPGIGRNGLVYSITSEAIRAKITPETLAELEELIDADLVLLVTDKNNTVWIIGSPLHPARLSFAAAWGLNYEERNQIALTINCQQPHAPAKYEPFNYLAQNGNQLVYQNNAPIIFN